MRESVGECVVTCLLMVGSVKTFHRLSTRPLACISLRRSRGSTVLSTDSSYLWPQGLKFQISAIFRGCLCGVGQRSKATRLSATDSPDHRLHGCGKLISMCVEESNGVACVPDELIPQGLPAPLVRVALLHSCIVRHSQSPHQYLVAVVGRFGPLLPSSAICPLCPPFRQQANLSHCGDSRWCMVLCVDLGLFVWWYLRPCGGGPACHVARQRGGRPRPASANIHHKQQIPSTTGKRRETAV